MWKIHIFLLIVGVIGYQSGLTEGCTDIIGSNGTIADTKQTRGYKSCWEIKVPSNKFARIKVQSLSLNEETCGVAYLRVTVKGINKIHTFCHNDINKDSVMALSDVKINMYYKSGRNLIMNFSVFYEVFDIECARENRFHCTKYRCIPKDQVCDGVNNCENGTDEVGCETGILSIPGVADARAKAIEWLKSKRTPSWGWHQNTPRAVTALFLGGGVNFNGKDLDDELMAKQLKLRIAVELLKKSVSNEDLAIFTNALLVTCHDPHQFYGHNLVKQLQEQVMKSGNLTHPITYLALCNANETWPVHAYYDLENIFNSNLNYPFMKDFQAFAVMAVACSINNTKVFNHTANSTLINQYQKTIKGFKEQQLADGSFGTVHTTALITQALIASGQEHAKDWKLNTTIKYLMKELNSTNVEFLSLFLTLPVMNGKSLADIFKINCSSHPRKQEEDLVSDIKDYPGPKIRVQYSLYVGDERDVIHTISLRVPENFTAYDVMQLAEIEDLKYKFKWMIVSKQIYVYRIGKVTNDSERGKFWLLYLGSSNSTDKPQHLTSSPDNVTLKEGDHFIMWYRKVEV